MATKQLYQVARLLLGQMRDIASGLSSRELDQDIRLAQLSTLSCKCPRDGRDQCMQVRGTLYDEEIRWGIHQIYPVLQMAIRQTAPEHFVHILMQEKAPSPTFFIPHTSGQNPSITVRPARKSCSPSRSQGSSPNQIHTWHSTRNR